VRKLKRASLLLVVFVAVALCIYLLSDSTNSSQSGERSVAGRERGSSKAQVKPACRTGSVSLTQTPGVLNFRVTCGPANSEEGRFIMGRYPFDNRQVSPGIQAVQRRPRIMTAGGRQSRGYCRLGEAVASCTGSAESSYEIHGKLWVRPSDQCKMGVVIYVVQPLKCEGGACRLSSNVRSLTKGLPKGC
jgi:hypothetical protein